MTFIKPMASNLATSTACILAFSLVGSVGQAQPIEGLYGNLSVDAATADTVQSISIEAGGDFDATAYGGDCAGLIAADTPDITITIDRLVSSLNVYVTSDADTTLVVRRPNGRYICNDDSFGTNPLVNLLKPSAGVYEVWIGSFENALAPARLHIGAGEPDWWGLMFEGSMDDGEVYEELLLSEPRYSAFSLQSPMMPDPIRVDVLAGGNDAAERFDWYCSGYIDQNSPDITLDVPMGFGDLSIYAISDADTTLIVRAPDGQLFCNDDTFMSNPEVWLMEPQPGLYGVWVGNYDEAIAPASLFVSQSRPDGVDDDSLEYDWEWDSDTVTSSLDLEAAEGSWAAEIGQTVIDALTGVVDDINREAHTSLVVATTGPVTARGSDDRVVITFPELVLAAGFNQVELGSPELEIMRLSNDDLVWSLRLGTAIDFTEFGERVARLAWGSSTLSGRFSVADEVMPQIDVQFEGLSFQVSDMPEIEASIAALRMFSDLTTDVMGLYSGDSSFVIEGIDVFSPEVSFALDRLEARSGADGVDYAAWKRIGDMLSGLLDDPQTMQMELSSVLSTMIIGKMDGSLVLDNLSVTDPMGQTYQIEQFKLISELDGRGTLGRVVWGVGLSGIDVEVDEVPSQFSPRQIGVEIALNDLPLQQLLALIGSANPMSPDFEMIIGIQALALLTQYQPELVINSFDLASDVFGMSGNGRLSMTQQMTPTGEAQIVLRGLADLIQGISNKSLGAGLGADALPGLIFLQGLGRPEQRNGEIVQVYDLAMTASYSVTINGVDLSNFPF